MVKNDGGNKGKGLARKHVNAAKCGGSKQLRMAAEDAEQYAVVSKMLGNGMCYVRLLSGGGDRLCIIRNKFKGRGKRDNILDSGSWVLVGLREWSSNQDTCDLLEVYNHGERDRLLKNEPCFKSIAAEHESGAADSAAAAVQFTDSTTMKYSKLVNGKRPDDDGDDGDDGELMQQRVYDMPSSSDDSDDDSDECESDETPVVASFQCSPAMASCDGMYATPTGASELKPNPKPNLRVNHINVDDI
jgi:translation initiation factor IF-1